MKILFYYWSFYFSLFLSYNEYYTSRVSPGFLLEIEFKMQLGVWGHCKLWLKQHSNLLKSLEIALFFGSNKWYSYCVITSNSCSHILLNSWKNPLQSSLLFTMPSTSWSCINVNFPNKHIVRKLLRETNSSPALPAYWEWVCSGEKSEVLFLLRLKLGLKEIKQGKE